MAKDKKSVHGEAAEKKYTRRDFLAVGGTALAGSALAVYPAKTPAAVKEDEYAPSTRYLVYDSKIFMASIFSFWLFQSDFGPM